MSRKRQSRNKHWGRWLTGGGMLALLAVLSVIFLMNPTAWGMALRAFSDQPGVAPNVPIANQLLALHLLEPEVPQHIKTIPPAAPEPPPLAPMPLVRIAPIVQPALPGEGNWVVQGNATGAYSYLPLVAKTFFRPDPARPSAIVTMLQFDTRFIRMHMVAGTTQPGGPRGVDGPGVIPGVDQQSNNLLAAFNGGFQYADGQYGMQVNGVTYVPAHSGDATIAVTKEGQIVMGAWGVDHRLTTANTDLLAWRQNVFPLLEHSVINPLAANGSLWGLTVSNQPWGYTWRSGLGLTANGTLIYAEGSDLSPETLAVALQAAGAVTAMQTDINHFWMRAFLYSRASNGSLQISKLDPGMYGTGTEYLTSTFRDFFYLTRYNYVPPTPLTPLRISFRVPYRN